KLSCISGCLESPEGSAWSDKSSTAGGFSVARPRGGPQGARARTDRSSGHGAESTDREDVRLTTRNRTSRLAAVEFLRCNGSTGTHSLASVVAHGVQYKKPDRQS